MANDNIKVTTNIISTTFHTRTGKLEVINYGNTHIHLIMSDDDGQHQIIAITQSQFNGLINIINLKID